MAWVGSPAQSQEPIFRNPFPRKSVGHVSKTNMAETVTRDMASSDQLKLKVLCLFRAQLSKNKSICDYAGARPQSDRSNTLIYFTLVNPQITTLQTLHATPYPTLLWNTIRLRLHLFSHSLYIIHFYIISTFPFPSKQHWTSIRPTHPPPPQFQPNRLQITLNANDRHHNDTVPLPEQLLFFFFYTSKCLNLNLNFVFSKCPLNSCIKFTSWYILALRSIDNLQPLYIHTRKHIIQQILTVR